MVFSFTDGGDVKSCDHFAKDWKFLKRLNLKLPNDAAIPEPRKKKC